MLCERCGVREANIRYIEVVNGVKTEHHLCSECAREMDFSEYSAVFDGDDPIGKLLSGILGVQLAVHPKKEEEWDRIRCPVCHTSYSEFVENSRFGCAQCYEVFDLLMQENVKKLQGSDMHTGKRPKFGRPEARASEGAVEKAELTREEELKILQSKLRDAVSEEEFEEAAKYRDAIRTLKERMGAGS
ncbi:MAG: excinuclease ABC subunit B [Lachnospiraceae bacterium]|nr:excinuclease ABC subunit B [Lachnospiraceae bacterium]